MGLKDNQKLEEKDKLPESYAIKVVEKAAHRINMASLLNEKKILLQVTHPFIIGLHYVFETKKRLFFVMDYMRCGDLNKMLRDKGHFKESAVKFYTAQIVLAIGCLHEKHIIYRDLKLENVLMQNDGYVNLADFGLSKFLDEEGVNKQRADTFCGTRPYLAPEIINGTKYDRNVDWWALGIMTYEMLHGCLPFISDNERMLFRKICKEDVKFR